MLASDALIASSNVVRLITRFICTNALACLQVIIPLNINSRGIGGASKEGAIGDSIAIVGIANCKVDGTVIRVASYRVLFNLRLLLE